AVNDFMDSVHHIWCPLSSQEYQDLPDGAETTLTLIIFPSMKIFLAILPTRLVEAPSKVPPITQPTRGIILPELIAPLSPNLASSLQPI
ncbi:hypothetical protein K1S53_25560, partial [Klebsiella pneumoniae]|nr:hypothetical protein [Klebsiella pneumoniae]